jgi:amidase
MAADFGFEELEAYMLFVERSRVRRGNMMDPKWALGASILKSRPT